MRHRLFFWSTIAVCIATIAYMIYLLFIGSLWVHALYWLPTLAWVVFAERHASIEINRPGGYL